MLDINFIILALVIIFALIFDFMNGFHDAANAIATCISTRALSIKTAIIMATVLNLVGAVVSTKVATTIGKGIVDPSNITQMVILVGLIGAILWGFFTWYFGIPSSSSHAIVGGIAGSAVAHAGFSNLHWHGLRLIIFSLLASPIIGAAVSFLGIIITFRLVHKKSPHVLNNGFKKLQIISAALMAFAHGTADAQKSMGIITMSLLSYGVLTSFKVPWEIIISCACVMALGTALGGWRIIKTVGRDFVKLQPIHGFCIQTASSGLILAASAFGLPTSTTHVITSSVLGVGLSKSFSAVNWRIAYNILLAAIFTVPLSGIVSFVIYKILYLVFYIYSNLV